MKNQTKRKKGLLLLLCVFYFEACKYSPFINGESCKRSEQQLEIRESGCCTLDTLLP